VRKLGKADIPPLVAALVLVTYLLTLAIYGSSANYSADKYLDGRLESSQDSVALNLDIVSINPNENTLDLLAVPRLSGDLGQTLATGSYVEKPISFIFDAYSEQTRWSPNPGDIQAAMPMKLRLIGDLDKYPFDSYEAQLFASVQARESQESLSIPLLINDLKEEIPGLNVKSSQVAFLSSETSDSTIENDRSTGVANLNWSVSRSTGVILIVVLLAMLILTGAVVSVFITIAILRGRRPPSINSLGWLAAFLFALFSVRAQLPGAPPSGVLFDVVIFYPTVLVLVLLIAVNVSAWVAREDWDMENPIFAVRGKFPEGTHERD
jgi:hypothetical protein